MVFSARFLHIHVMMHVLPETLDDQLSNERTRESDVERRGGRIDTENNQNDLMFDLTSHLHFHPSRSSTYEEMTNGILTHGDPQKVLSQCRNGDNCSSDHVRVRDVDLCDNEKDSQVCNFIVKSESAIVMSFVFFVCHFRSFPSRKIVSRHDV